jgi:hypothetical protein
LFSLHFRDCTILNLVFLNANKGRAVNDRKRGANEK